MLFRFLICVTAIFLAGCSAFHRDWRKSAEQPAPGISGRWEGHWQSHNPTHHGRLRCLLTPLDAERYEARFHAKYKKILSFGYTAEFRGKMSNDVFWFKGEADLGKLAGGVYRYEGRIAPTNFFSTYDSKYDRGTFQLKPID